MLIIITVTVFATSETQVHVHHMCTTHSSKIHENVLLSMYINTQWHKKEQKQTNDRTKKQRKNLKGPCPAAADSLDVVCVKAATTNAVVCRLLVA